MSKLSKKLDAEIRLEAKNRCGYCLGEQKYILAWLEIEHLHPRAKGGKTIKENLWLVYTSCNTFKSSQTCGTDPKTRRKPLLFNPRKQKWKNHFEFNSDRATISGKLFVDGRRSMPSKLTVNWLLK